MKFKIYKHEELTNHARIHSMALSKNKELGTEKIWAGGSDKDN